MQKIDDFGWWKRQSILNDYDKLKRKLSEKYNVENPLFYHCNPLYNHIIGNKQFHYAYIDDVLVIYKVIRLFSTHQIRIFDCDSMIRDKLQAIPFIRFCGSAGDEHLPEYDNFYYDLTRKHIETKDLKKFENGEFSYQIYNDFTWTSYKDGMEIRRAWVAQSIRRGVKVSSSSTNDFIQFIKSEDAHVIKVLVYHGNEPVSIRIMLLNDFGYADSLFYNTLYDTDNKAIRYKMRNYQLYLAQEYLMRLGIKRLYLAGCRSTDKRIWIHKNMVSDGVVKCFIT